MALQSLHIRDHEQRSQPSSHTVYKIEIQASVRSWLIWKRYSEFADLHSDLTKTTGLPPPEELPPKHSFSLRRKFNEDSLVKERTAALDAYMRAILAHKDPRWRESYVFKEFLGIPISKGADGRALPDTSGSQFTSASWLDEHSDIQSLVRDIRADLNRRDSLSDRGEVAAAGNANVQAKKKITNLLKRMEMLAKGLETLALHGMSQGELQRRTELVARLQDDCQKLSSLVLQPTRGNQSGSVLPSETLSDAKKELLSTHNGPSTHPVARVFGGSRQPPQETATTRPLDDEGVYQLQQQQIQHQDDQLTLLTAVLRRQKQLGIAIGNELEEQITMLDDLDANVDKFGNKLGKAKKQLNRLG